MKKMKSLEDFCDGFTSRMFSFRLIKRVRIESSYRIVIFTTKLHIDILVFKIKGIKN